MYMQYYCSQTIISTWVSKYSGLSLIRRQLIHHHSQDHLIPIMQCKLGWCWNAIANYLIGFQAYIAQRC